MADILQEFDINAAPGDVFKAVATPKGLDAWWTLTSAGEPAEGSEYELEFGPDYAWRAVVSRCVSEREFELRMTEADDDWRGSRVGFTLGAQAGKTRVRFHHVGWPEPNGHFRTSAHCWALYLRLMRRYVEHGEVVPYDQRLDA